MEKRTIAITLALTLPLLFYGVPYTYATTQTTYAVWAHQTVPAGRDLGFEVVCDAGDNAVSFFLASPIYSQLETTDPINHDLSFISQHGTPNGYFALIKNTYSTALDLRFYILCQSPITVAGITVPEFGSLYATIALGAMVYFMLSRRFAGRPAPSAKA